MPRRITQRRISDRNSLHVRRRSSPPGSPISGSTSRSSAQQKDGCGAASIAMVMQYWEQQQGQPTQPGGRARADSPRACTPTRRTASTPRRWRATSSRTAFAPSPSRQIGWTSSANCTHGRPLIVALKPGSGPSLHYVVVAGLDEPQQLVLVNDPAQRKLLKEDQSQFEREWKAAGNWTLLAVPETSAN